ncbi:hypothetical protein I551_5316 [Mycobacterium ulcerans str. Harvey]|uniref:Uncharacterized protein n=1 Tax=Mycobacterium ulcerans str. Harvey TaxID=1299332 RepID=A0ABN0QUA3_MYCUL|nr:hypothetical protein I551_5316 [Mycobacterium ulcerans str. Harvey]
MSGSASRSSAVSRLASGSVAPSPGALVPRAALVPLADGRVFFGASPVVASSA